MGKIMAQCFVLLLLLSNLYADKHDDELNLVKKYLKKDPIILEAGAHDGTDSVKMIKKWPKATIHAFEPRPDVYRILCKRTKKYKKVHTYQLALGERSCRQTLYLSSSTQPNQICDAQSSLFPPDKTNWPKELDEKIQFDQGIQVKVRSLDDWARNNRISQIDFLWLDLQGNEFQVLNASPYAMSRVSVIKTEVSEKPLYKGTLPYAQYKKWLQEKGFVCIQDCNEFHGDAIFVRKTLVHH